ncbi:GNAT family N-acetyltransferase [Dyella ginsengisoli]|jgi:ribosomal protein S18 acetylase RimI-like enzyme|uniref:GNAT family N-acetyltransferase n=1 Tax=Dyella ginsengisoli TaxID=363848 RepID=A0ABW8JRS9_9GAMM
MLRPPLPPESTALKATHTAASSVAHAPATAAVRVRRAELSDLDDLVALEDATFDSDRMSRAQYRRHLDSDSASVLVASANHRRFLGTAVVFYRKGSRVARLYSLASRPEARGKGVGSALLATVEQAARQRGCRELRLEVRLDNASAIRLYERLGYRRLGRLERFYEDGADAWRYGKRLD